MGYNPHESAPEDGFGNLFKNSINTDDIKSMDDITDDMLLNKEGAYFDHSEIGNDGECLTLNFEVLPVYTSAMIFRRRRTPILP